MSNPNGAKGTAWETAVERFLAVLGCKRVPRRGAKDEGDHHTANWLLECKNSGRIEPSTFMNEVYAELPNAGKRWGAAVVKRRRGTGSPGTVETGYVFMDLATFRDQEADRLELEKRCEDLQIRLDVLREEIHGNARIVA